MDISDVLKDAIRQSGMTHYRLGKNCGVATAMIDRFVSGQRDVRLGTAAKLASSLGLEMGPVVKNKKKS